MVAERGMLLPRERIPERTCEQVVDVRVRQAVEQVLEVPKNSSQDRHLQGTVEQTQDDPVLEMVEQLVKLPKTFLRTESSSGLWSASLKIQFRRLWENWWRSSRCFLRTGFNSVSRSRPLILLAFLSLRRSSRGLSLRRNRL